MGDLITFSSSEIVNFFNCKFLGCWLRRHLGFGFYFRIFPQDVGKKFVVQERKSYFYLRLWFSGNRSKFFRFFPSLPFSFYVCGYFRHSTSGFFGCFGVKDGVIFADEIFLKGIEYSGDVVKFSYLSAHFGSHFFASLVDCNGFSHAYARRENYFQIWKNDKPTFYLSKSFLTSVSNFLFCNYFGIKDKFKRLKSLLGG